MEYLHDDACPLGFVLRCPVQTYHWGKLGADSFVATLKAAGDADFVIDEGTRYAELWMGTHPSGPAKILNRDKTLEDLGSWIQTHPESLGTKILETFGHGLPFLFKVLSVDKPLSIQAHPDKALAEVLHVKKPEFYKDPNHKPEMAIALTRFEALCGFRPVSEILHFLEVVPELASVVGKEASEQLKNAHVANDPEQLKSSLKAAFSKIMFSDEDTVKKTVTALVQRLQNEDGSVGDEDPTVGDMRDLVVRCNQEFPNDVGCLGAYFFNHLYLEPGQAIFLEANEPHAYIFGNCMEVMACSDNVVRAGLTPKAIDKETLCDMLTYKTDSADKKVFTGQPLDYGTDWNPPVPDFALRRLEIPETVKEYLIPKLDSASIISIIKGQGEVDAFYEDGSPLHISPGTVLFLPQATTLPLRLSGEHKMLFFQAYCSL